MNFIHSTFLILLMLLAACRAESPAIVEFTPPISTEPHLLVLGVAQDAGYPQTACRKACCRLVWEGKEEKKHVSCLALVDPAARRAWLFDATPDFREQWQMLEERNLDLAGVFLTHAHIGHYTGLMQLGHEVMGAQNVPVYAMPRMKKYLETNGPWSQLVNFKNIELLALNADSTIVLPGDFKITPFPVPHRDEYSETVGYQIAGPEKTAVFIPDINKWEHWDRDISQLVQEVDYAFLDATFYVNGEIPGRDMSEILHPFIEESMARFDGLSLSDRQKIHFIHLNHTNPVLRKDSEARKTVLEKGYEVAEEGGEYGL